jgi:hypothetical protein
MIKNHMCLYWTYEKFNSKKITHEFLSKSMSNIFIYEDENFRFMGTWTQITQLNMCLLGTDIKMIIFWIFEYWIS